MHELPRKARAYVALTCALAVGALIAGVAYGLDLRVVLVLSAMTLIVERLRPATANYGGSTIGLHMTLPMVIAAGVLGGPGDATVVGLVSAVTSVSLPLVKRLFNSAQFALSAATAGWILEAFAVWSPEPGTFQPGYLLAVLAASIGYCIVNAALLSGVLWFAAGTNPRHVVFGAVAHTAPAYVGYGVLGLMMAVVWIGAGPVAALLVLLPVVVARWAFLQYANEQQAYEATIRTLVQAVETKDHYTRGHSERVAKASVMLARVLGMREDRVSALRYAGILHDVGKLGIPTEILQSTGGLSDEQFATIKEHPRRGTAMLDEIEFLDEAIKGILHHHERIDGLGYPDGLSGEQIPEFARVIHVADAFDSMTSTRSYRGARTPEEAVHELERCKGTQFDPVMVDALVEALVREPWVPTTPEPDDEVGVPLFDDDDPTVDALAGREREQ